MRLRFSILTTTLVLLAFTGFSQARKITTVAGSNSVGNYGGDGFAATGALLNGPHQIALDKLGNMYIVDYYNFRVRKVKTNGTIVTFAGSGVGGYTGDSSAATTARMFPQGVAADFRGVVYISDPVNNVIRRVNQVGIISTYAGIGVAGYTGDTGAATGARLRSPFGMACDKKGNLIFADAGNHVIRKIDTFGIITTIVGTGTAGYSGDGLPAISAQLDSPYSVTLDDTGNMYIADRNNNVVRMVDLNGDIYTVAGNGLFGYSGDGGTAVAARLNYPTGVAVDTAGNIYISDSYNNVIRKVDAAGIITTFAGNGTPAFGGDLGDPLGANLHFPYDVATDTFGNVFIADANNQRVRKVYVVTLGVETASHGSNGITVYPNPAGNTITVTGAAVNDAISIIDAAGRVVIAGEKVNTNGRHTIAVGSFPAGLYFVQAGNSKAIQFIKE